MTPRVPLFTLAAAVSVMTLFAPYGIGIPLISPTRVPRSASPTPDSINSSTIDIEGSTIEIKISPGRLALPATRIIGWISTSARAVAGYYGRFPVRDAQILIIPVEGRKGVLHGTSWGSHPAFTRVYLGELSDDSDLKKDWVMTHEMVHFAFPSVSSEHEWIEEGIATYVEPIARLGVGEIGAAKVWGDLVEGLPLGEPGPGDRGLDRTHTWGRTYWGGAMFCLLADIRIRRETRDRYGLRDALRGIVDAGGNMQTSWPITRAFDVGDKAVGVPVLQQLYSEMKTSPVKPELQELWSKLGVKVEGKTITLDDNAPWASVRRAIASDPA